MFDAKGKYLRSWGKGLFGNPHGLRIDKQDHVWITDNGDHQVMEFSNEGRLLRTWGIKGKHLYLIDVLRKRGVQKVLLVGATVMVRGLARIERVLVVP